MIFGPVSHTEVAGWQYRSARALLEILTAARALGMPPISWTVSTGAMLLGRCSGGWGTNRLEQFNAWRDMLQPDKVSERESIGRTHHRFEVNHPNDPLVKVIVQADIDVEPEQ